MFLYFIQTIASMLLTSLLSSADIKKQPTLNPFRVAKKQLASSELNHH